MRVEPKPERAQRLYKAASALLQMGCASPVMISKWLGHAVYHSMLSRPALSAFGHCYGFVREGDWKTWRRMSPLVLDEVRVFRGLILLAGVLLGLPRAPLMWFG